MNRRAFLKSAGLTTAAVIGAHTATATAPSSMIVEKWTRPWGTGGHTRTTQSEGVTADEVGVAWTSNNMGYMKSTPTVSEGLVYTLERTDEARLTGAVSAHDTKTGEQVWRNDGTASGKTDSHGNPVHYGDAYDAPVVANGLLYFVAGEGEDFTGDSVVGGVFALDAKTGKEVWRRDDLHGGVTVTDETVIVTQGDYLIALGASAGETRWKVSNDVSVIGVVDGTLYTYTVDDATHNRADKIIAYDVASGTTQWQAAVPNSIGGIPRAVDEELIYLVAPESAGEEGMPPEISALSTADGFVQWTKTLSVRDGTVEVSSPAVDESQLYVFTRSDEHFGWLKEENEDLDAVGTIFALDRTTGEEQWRFETPAKLAGDPVVDANRLYAAARYHTCSKSPSVGIRGGLYALDKTTGEAQWNIAPSGLLSVSPPAIGDGEVYQATDDVGDSADSYLIAYSGRDHPPDCDQRFADEGKTRTVPTPDVGNTTTTTTHTTTTKTGYETTGTSTTTSTTETTAQSTTVESTTESAAKTTTTSNSMTTTTETTATDGQPGFGINAALVGIVGGGLYTLRSRINNER